MKRLEISVAVRPL